MPESISVLYMPSPKAYLYYWLGKNVLTPRARHYSHFESIMASSPGDDVFTALPVHQRAQPQRLTKFQIGEHVASLKINWPRHTRISALKS
jgi:hypothetical protein